MTLRQKILLLATIPLLVAVAVIMAVVNRQAEAVSAQEIALFEKTMLAAKKAELLNYMSLAETSIEHLTGIPRNSSAEDVIEAQTRAKQILNSLTFGEDGYFFVYDLDGTSVVHPKQGWRVGQNYLDLRDKDDRPVIRNLIAAAKAGGGFTRYAWEQPSRGDVTDKIGYAVLIEPWGWMMGTGIYIDDVITQAAAARAGVDARIRQTFLLIGGITLATVLAVFATWIVINIRESRLADAKLQALAQKVTDAQEDERGRVARELHDSISQILVSVKYMLQRARRAPDTGEALGKAEENLNLAITEVRRISHDLRPGLLDDLGLSRALQNLGEEFATRTGIAVDVQTTAFKNLLPDDVKTALYRIAQEALTNVERHAGASRVELGVTHGQEGVVLKITDDGCGFDPAGLRASRKPVGIGLKNMAERIARHGGKLSIDSNAEGTGLRAWLPRGVLRSGGAVAAPRAAEPATDAAWPAE
ncbi:MAG: cache domain-containing protein [Pseudomonadota bacterium]